MLVTCVSSLKENHLSVKKDMEHHTDSSVVILIYFITRYATDSQLAPQFLNGRSF